MILVRMLSVCSIVGVAGLASAGPRDFLVEHSGVGGSAEQAAPYLDQFLRYIESKMSWPKGSASAQFFPEPEAAVSYAKDKHPAYGLLDPELFLELQKKEDLEVLVTVEGKNESLGHYSVVVKDPAYKTLEDLKGKSLISNHLQYPKFLSRVAFAGKVDAATFFKLEPTPSPLKGLKAVDRGEAAATLLDDNQLANMKSLPFGAELRVIYTSPALPPTPFVVFGKNALAKDRAAIVKMLTGMCADPKGAEVCTSLQVSKFSNPNKAQYDEAVKRFEK